MLLDFEHGREVHVFLLQVTVVILLLLKLVFVDTETDKDEFKRLGLIVGPLP